MRSTPPILPRVSLVWEEGWVHFISTIVMHFVFAKHCTIKPLMVFKASENAKAQTLAIHGNGSSQIVNRTRDSEVMLHGRSHLGAEWSNALLAGERKRTFC